MDGILEEKLTTTHGSSQPELFDLAQEKDINHLSQLFEAHVIQNVADDYEEQIRELFAINNPSLVYTPAFKEQTEAHLADLKREKPLWQQGRWVFYPWLSTIVHILTDEDFQKVRTARNKNLINADEQEKFYNAVIGIGGLSVGNNVVLAIVQQGGGNIFGSQTSINWR